MGQILDIVINILQQIQQAERSIVNGQLASLPSLPIFEDDRVLREQLDKLTPMERKIMNQLADDMTVLEIANHFKLSKRTVETHRNNITKKLHLASVKHIKTKLIPFLKRAGKLR